MAADGAFPGLVGCQLPIQLASLGGPIGTPELAGAVSNAGGLGMIPNPSSAVEVQRVLTIARGLTSGPLGVGFLVPFVVREAVDEAAESADVVGFFYGDPAAELVRLAGARSAVMAPQSCDGRTRLRGPIVRRAERHPAPARPRA